MQLLTLQHEPFIRNTFQKKGGRSADQSNVDAAAELFVCYVFTSTQWSDGCVNATLLNRKVQVPLVHALMQCHAQFQKP